MNSPILVDILHADDDQALLSRRMEEKFFDQVVSRSEADFKICVEGYNTGLGGMDPSHKNYSGLMSACWPNHSSDTRIGTIYAVDPRAKIDFTKNRELLASTQAMLTILDNLVTLKEKPGSIEDALEWIRAGYCRIEIRGHPDSKVKALADKLFKLEKLFIKYYTELAIHLSRSGKQVYVVAGLSHVLGLHIKNDWSMMWLTRDDPWITPENVYRSGMNLTGFLDLIRRL